TRVGCHCNHSALFHESLPVVEGEGTNCSRAIDGNVAGDACSANVHQRRRKVYEAVNEETIMSKKLKLFLLVAVASLLNTAASQAQPGAPELFTYAELVQLYEHRDLPEALQAKLNRLRTTPFVSNSQRGVQPMLPKTPALGTFVRVVQWNIERGIEYPA